VSPVAICRGPQKSCKMWDRKQERHSLVMSQLPSSGIASGRGPRSQEAGYASLWMHAESESVRCRGSVLGHFFLLVSGAHRSVVLISFDLVYRMIS